MLHTFIPSSFWRIPGDWLGCSLWGRTLGGDLEIAQCRGKVTVIPDYRQYLWAVASWGVSYFWVVLRHWRIPSSGFHTVPGLRYTTTNEADGVLSLTGIILCGVHTNSCIWWVINLLDNWGFYGGGLAITERYIGLWSSSDQGHHSPFSSTSVHSLYP